MIKAKANKDLTNVSGKSILKDEECFIKDVWLNNTINDVYCKLIKGDIDIITSIDNVRWKE